MINKRKQEVIEVSIPKKIPNPLNQYQDKLSFDSDQHMMTTNITKKQKDFVIQNNKYFFGEFCKLYTKNILLQSKLKELLIEKKKLNQIIIKQEQQSHIKKPQKSEEKEIIKNKIKSEIIDPYFKKKRKRRKKTELVNRHKCPYPNCEKSYPSKGSLNMHVKIKHLPQKSLYYFNDKSNS